MRLIDADALIESANEFEAYGYVSAFEISLAPTVDAVQVVRCKDCVHFSMGSTEFGIENDCDFHEWYRAEPKEDDYCSRGEEKDDGT